MIKIWLKHLIYEACIEAFFNQVYDNFVSPKIINPFIGRILMASKKIAEASRVGKPNVMLMSRETYKIFRREWVDKNAPGTRFEEFVND